MGFWWHIIKRAMVWAFLGSICTTLLGGVCGVVMAAFWCLPSSWASASSAGFIGTYGWFRWFTEVASVAGTEGCIAGGIPGLFVFFVLSFFCSFERVLLRLPLRFVLLGMVLGVLASIGGMVVVTLFLSLVNPSAWGGVWPPDLFLVAICGPAGLVLGQVAGAIYTGLVTERRERKAELDRWSRILESDYDFSLSRFSRHT